MCIFFFFNDTATTEIYTLSLHDALPISAAAARSPRSLRSSVANRPRVVGARCCPVVATAPPSMAPGCRQAGRSEEHTSELQSRQYLVCRLLLEKKKKQDEKNRIIHISHH